MYYNRIAPLLLITILSACGKDDDGVECLPPPPQTPDFRLVDKNTGADVLEKYQDFTAANTPVAKESCSDYRVPAATFGYKQDSASAMSYFFHWQYAPSLQDDNCRTLYLQHTDGDVDTIKFDGYVEPASGAACDVTKFIIKKVYFNGAEVQPVNTGKILSGEFSNGITYYPLQK